MVRKTLPKFPIVRVANAFAKTGEILFEKMPEEIEWPYPLVVNFALSIELYLKSYIAEDDWVPYLVHDDGSTTYHGFLSCNTREHNLDTLYLKIDYEIRNRIEVEFSNSHLSDSFESFRDALFKFRSSFIEARYPYERSGFKGGCISDLKEISFFLRSAIYKIGELRYI